MDADTKEALRELGRCAVALGRMFEQDPERAARALLGTLARLPVVGPILVPGPPRCVCCGLREAFAYDVDGRGGQWAKCDNCLGWWCGHLGPIPRAQRPQPPRR